MGPRQRWRSSWHPHPQDLGPSRWLVLGVLCVTLLLVSLDNTILNTALPVIAQTMSASTSELQWIVDIYAVVFAGLLLVLGSMGDRVGRKWVFMAGLAVFGTGSALSAFSSTPDRLIAARAFMGVGAAAIMPSTLSILTNVFTATGERSKAIGLWSGTSGLGISVGPVAGGWLLAHYWWGSVFLVNVPLAFAGLVATALIVPNSRDSASRAADPVGALLSIAGMTLLLWAIIDAAARSWTSPAVLGALFTSLAALGGFAVWERHCDHPMLRLAYFRRRSYSVAMSGMAMVMFALMGCLFVLTQYLQFFLGYGPLAAGLRVAPVAAVLLVVSPLSVWIVGRLGAKPVVAAGMVLIAGGLAGLSGIGAQVGYGSAVPYLLLLGCGAGLVIAPCTDSVMGSVSLQEAGVGSATNGAAIQTGGALGVAVLGSLLNGRYRSNVGRALSGFHVAKSVSDLIVGSLGATIEAARRIGGVAGAGLAAVGRSAFISGMHLAMGVAALVAAVSAGLILALLGGRTRADRGAGDRRSS